MVNHNPTEQNKYGGLQIWRYVECQRRNKNWKWRENERFRDKCHVSSASWLSLPGLFLLLHRYLPGEWGGMAFSAPVFNCREVHMWDVAFKVFIISDPLIGYYKLLRRAENTSLKTERKRWKILTLFLSLKRGDNPPE